MPRFSTPTRDLHPHLVVVGGGVGGLEAALALRALAGPLPGVELISPEPEFVYRAMTVAAPFGYGLPPSLHLERLQRDREISFRHDALTRVNVTAQTVTLNDGVHVSYDALVVAHGARTRPWLHRALHFEGRAAVAEFQSLLDRMHAGEVTDVVFAAPPGASWTLPLYELALLTASWCGERGVPAPSLHLVTPEAEPLGVFGPAATRLLRDLMSDHGITVHAGDTAENFAGRRVRLDSGYEITADAVVAMPELRGNPVAGLPSDERGFIPVDEHGEVIGAPGVYCVGDAADHSIKQGGLASQQADVAAAAIVASLGVPIAAPPYAPVLRGMLLTGVAAAYLRTGPDERGAGFSALWWPPTKVAGRYLSGYLADLHPPGAPVELSDRRPSLDVERAARERADLRALALDMAKADSQWGEYASALRWLQTIEWLDGALPHNLTQLRDTWAEKAHVTR